MAKKSSTKRRSGEKRRTTRKRRTPRRAGKAATVRTSAPPEANSYRHPTADSPLRPDVGTQANFRKKKPPVTYRYDSSLSPALDWDGQNFARELGEQQIAAVEKALGAAHAELEQVQVKLQESPNDPQSLERLKAVTQKVALAAEANRKLKGLSKPFLNWSGKAERLSFDVPTLPLFVHERLSTQAIIETLTGHYKPMHQLGLFADPQRSIADQMLKAYEHRDKWVNRMILGDSMVVMNSLLHYESLGGQVQMIYMDPPYGIKFGSNFQPFVRKRDVSHNDDDDMTREPEMVQAYRDTWELGLHSYLTYMRDRLTLARELLAPSGSIFVQINDENLHHVRELMDELFGHDNFLVTIFMRKKGSQRGNEVRPINDHIVWYARDKTRLKRRFVYDSKMDATDLSDEFDYVEHVDGRCEPIGEFESEEIEQLLRDGAKLYVPEPLTSGGEYRTQLYPVEIDGRVFRPPANNCWKFSEDGMNRIRTAGRIHIGTNQIRFKKYHTDFPFRALNNLWADMAGASKRMYAVQTVAKAIQRCILMTTDPGDLVLDPTCGSGTTAFVSEQWGRRWITCDVSRVPLALARQRLLTATFPWYELKDDTRGPAGGFNFTRKQNSRGEDTGGIVPHITSTSIANNAIGEEEVLVDRPEEVSKITRVTGPFAFEATIPTPVDLDGDGTQDSGAAEEYAAFEDRMLEVLRKSPLMHLDGNRTVKFKNIRKPAKSLSLSAEAFVEGATDGGSITPEEAAQISKERSGQSLPLSAKPVAFVFGPENGAVSERSVYMAAMEANAKGYSHLYVIGFEIQGNARTLIENCDKAIGIPATFVKATLDLMMGDLLKNMRSSQIFSVCGLPEIEVRKIKGNKTDNEPAKYEVELKGLDVFDPVTMKNDPRKGDDVPAWFLDTDYNGLCFHVSQAFFPRTGAWDNLKKALRATHAESVWDHLAGTISAPFEPGEQKQVAVKVIDDRGNELMVVKAI